MTTLQDVCNRAVAHHQAGQFVQAEPLYTLILQHQPRNLPIRLNLVHVLHALGKDETALNLLREGLAVDHTVPELHTTLSTLLTKLGRPLEGLLHSRRAEGLEQARHLEAQLPRYQVVDPTAVPGRGRDLVLTTAIGYSKERLAPFVRSLKASGFTGDLVMFVAELAPDTIRFLRDYGATLRSFDTHVHLDVHLNMSRFLRYYEFLRDADFAAPDGTAPYDRILLTDVQDVVFQKNPFNFPERHSVYFFFEDEEWPFGRCPINKTYVEMAFGTEGYERWKENLISCAGTTIGTFAGIMQYLIHMQIIYLRTRNYLSRWHSIDQSIHNRILYDDLIPRCGAFLNGGLVQTMGRVQREFLTLQPDGLVANRDGSVSAIVHQYNRHEDIAAAYQALFPAD